MPQQPSYARSAFDHERSQMLLFQQQQQQQQEQLDYQQQCMEKLQRQIRAEQRAAAAQKQLAAVAAPLDRMSAPLPFWPESSSGLSLSGPDAALSDLSPPLSSAAAPELPAAAAVPRRGSGGGRLPEASQTASEKTGREEDAACVPDLLRGSGAFSQSGLSLESDPRRLPATRGPLNQRLVVGLAAEEDEPVTEAPPPAAAPAHVLGSKGLAAAATQGGPPLLPEPHGTAEAELTQPTLTQPSIRSDSVPVSLVSRRVVDQGDDGAVHPDFRDDCSSLSSLDASRAAAGTPVGFMGGLAGGPLFMGRGGLPAPPPAHASLPPRGAFLPPPPPPAIMQQPDAVAALGRVAPSRHALGRAQTSSRPCRQWLESGNTYCAYGDLCRFQHA